MAPPVVLAPVCPVVFEAVCVGAGGVAEGP